MEILAYIYYIVTTVRNSLYDKGIFKIKKVDDVEVICVGNITVGGTGKTPAVQHFTKKLKEKGKKVAIVSRGYRGKRKRDPLLVSDGREIFASPEESGDEPYLHAINARVPVIVGKNRYKACFYAKKHFDIDTIILDDGFQHRKLKRNRDVVLIDATNPFGGKALLPKGTLREDLKRGLKRASEFIITKSDLASEKEVETIKKYLRRYQKNISVAKHGVSALCDLKGNMKPLFWIKGKRVLLFSGLANPLNFEKTVISLEPEYIERVDFMDHHHFKKKDFQNIEKRAEIMNADYIITTEKDLVKLPRDFNLSDTYVLKIEFTMIEDNILK
ncbi:tetraacyldisaccharide 4'-kinase [Ilyobacter polytropus]|uniref:Tetraacyldisaccharide 4'-kinase n=1 Tax=Ilyobacter polytropus (strain ATCC 51220 / DSM 2926 / LMG 16218 / CuHBu1) TaxID=572544 RepID=E3H7G9_ILYPC|nr:tetraacyldisaccharide 4'-kinase [Ilyobacter polytropus]ADO82865.1 lipid-A-disaccharide kinase [Ilyobacter polytropus DSM 2926]